MNALNFFGYLFQMFFVAVLGLTLVPSVHAWTIVDDATGGDCTSIGKWKEESLTCILRTDLSEGISIEGDSITLECDGHSVSGYSEIGIVVLGREGITIQDCIVEGFDIGVKISSSNDIALQNNRINSFFTGIDISSSNHNTLKNNYIHSVGGAGIVLSSSNHNTLKDNISDGNGGGSGIYLEYSNNSYLKGNTCNGNSGVGFYINYSNTIYLSKNTADYNDFFGYVFNGNDIALKHNECFGNFEGGSLPSGLCSPQIEGENGP